jgi:para-aminobenzoate synthetase/4-amino-4-deoxychorismate lyase
MWLVDSFVAFLLRGGPAMIALLLTPPLERGALPGILREEFLLNGSAVEHPITRADLTSGIVFIGNSARGLLPARAVHTAETRTAG